MRNTAALTTGLLPLALGLLAACNSSSVTPAGQPDAFRLTTSASLASASPPSSRPTPP